MEDASENLRPAAKSIHGVALGAFFLLTMALALLYYRYANVDVWRDFKAIGELRDIHYSERVYVESIFRTWANTWSNLAFVLVGFYALAWAHRDRRKTSGWLHAAPGTTPPALTALFGIACAYLGLGSGIFHASLTRWGQQLDVASMYPPMLALIAILLHRNIAHRLPARYERAAPRFAAALIITVAIAAILLYHYKWSMSSGTVLPAHVLALAIAYAFDRLLGPTPGRLPWLAASFLALVAGTTCRQIDVAGNFSGPDAWYQGHAFWHILCALSLAAGWIYTRGLPGTAST